MTMTDPEENLPRPAAEPERLAGYYGSRDTSADMEHGTPVEPPGTDRPCRHQGHGTGGHETA
jgi:hypothetical protein